MTAPKPLTSWQQTLPSILPRHIRRNIELGDGDCWLWMRSRDRDGYGWASLHDRTHQAHRLVFVLVMGPPPAGLVLDHLCRVRHCVSPAHLQPVTNRENLARGETPTGAKTCSEGHLLTWTGSQRRCLICAKKRTALYRKGVRVYRKKAA